MTTNKSGKFSRGGSISKTSNIRRYLGEGSETGNNSGIYNY